MTVTENFLPGRFLRQQISPDPDPPQQIAGYFAKHRQLTLQRRAGPRIWPRRHVDRANAFVLQQFADAENVIRVADRDATMQAVGAHDDRAALRGYRGVPPLGLANQRALGNAALAQVRLAHSAFAESRVPRRASGGDYD